MINWMMKHRMWSLVVLVTVVLGTVDAVFDTDAVFRLSGLYVWPAILITLVRWLNNKRRYNKAVTR